MYLKLIILFLFIHNEDYVFGQSQPQYQVPDPFFQAKFGGGFRAYMPDDCGLENFEFRGRLNQSDESAWFGGNVSKPDDGQWTFESSRLTLAPGDRLQYNANVKRFGKQYRHPDSEWIVPDLVNDFKPPTGPKRQPCEPQRPQSPPPQRRPPIDDDFMKPPHKTPCPWAEVPHPNDPREVVLEKQLVGLQCEMSAFMDRSARLQFQLTQELTDLKKLNYAAVARMQRLETLIRSMSRSYPSYPFI